MSLTLTSMKFWFYAIIVATSYMVSGIETTTEAVQSDDIQKSATFHTTKSDLKPIPRHASTTDINIPERSSSRYDTMTSDSTAATWHFPTAETESSDNVQGSSCTPQYYTYDKLDLLTSHERIPARNGTTKSEPFNVNCTVEIHNNYRRKVKAANMDEMYYSLHLQERISKNNFCNWKVHDPCIAVWQDIPYSSPSEYINMELGYDFDCAEYNSTSRTLVCKSDKSCADCDLRRFEKVVWHDAQEVGCVFQICTGYNNSFACIYNKCGKKGEAVYIPSGANTPVCSMCPRDSFCRDGLCARSNSTSTVTLLTTSRQYATTEPPFTTSAPVRSSSSERTSLNSTMDYLTSTPLATVSRRISRSTTRMNTPTSPFFPTTTSNDNARIEKQLEQLNKTNITTNNAFNVTKQVSHLINGSKLTPEDVDLVVDILGKVANLPSIPKDVFHPFMMDVNLLLDTPESTLREAETEYKTSQKIIRYIAKLVDHLNLPPQPNGTVNDVNYFGPNFAIIANSAKCDRNNLFYNGLLMADGNVQQLNTTTYYPNFIPSGTGNSVTWIQLPKNTFCSSPNDTAKISFSIYDRLGFFPESKIIDKQCNTSFGADSLVATAHISQSDKTLTTKLSADVQMGFSKSNGTETSSLQKIECGYYDSKTVTWSSRGCRKNDKLTHLGYYSCRCDHLTDFALLVMGQDSNALVCNNILSILGTVAAVVSSVSMVILLVATIYAQTMSNTAVVANKATYQGNETFQLIFFYSTILIFFLTFAIFSDKKSIGLTDSSCAGIAAMLYWLLLSIFIFALFRGIHFYRLWIELFRRHHSIWNVPYFGRTTSAIALGLPFIVAFAVFLGKRKVYQRDDNFCWIQSDYITYMVIIPATLFLIVNIGFSIVISQRILFGINSVAVINMKQFIAKRQDDRLRLLQLVLFVISLQIVLQIPWILQYFSYISPSANGFHYAFTIINGFQGLWLLLHHFYMKVLKQQQIKARSMSLGSTMTSSLEDSANGRSKRSKSAKSNAFDTYKSRGSKRDQTSDHRKNDELESKCPDPQVLTSPVDSYDLRSTMTQKDFDALYDDKSRGYMVPGIPRRNGVIRFHPKSKGENKNDTTQSTEQSSNRSFDRSRIERF